MEIKMADIAMNKSNNQAVKNLAQTLKSDHQSNSDKLKGLANDNGWDFPAAMDNEHQKNVDKLQNTSANDFDKQYVDMMVDGHKGAIKKFEAASKKFGNGAGDYQAETNVNPATANSSTKGQYGQSAQKDSVPNNNRSATTHGNSTNNRAMDTADTGAQQIEAYVNETLPVLRKHLQLSQQVQDGLKK